MGAGAGESPTSGVSYTGPVRQLSLVLGLLLTVGATIAAIASMVVPRATRRGLSHAVTTGVLSAMRAPLRIPLSYRTQDRWLRLAAPISVLVQLAVYVFLVIVGTSLIIYGQFDLTWKQAAWQAAATVTTLGTTEAVNWSSSMTAAVGAFLGLVIIAVFMGYLVGLYSAYVARESFMARFAQVAGEPAWGPMVLARSEMIFGDVDSAFAFDDWTEWITDLRVGQQASPVLAHFRSPDPMRHWTITMLAMLDASSLALALGDVRDRGAAICCVSEGTLTLAVLNRKHLDQEWRNLAIERSILNILESTDERFTAGTGSLEDDEWEKAVELLTVSGVADDDALVRARPKFEAIRALYIDDAMAIARSLHSVRALWSGPRSFVGAVCAPATPITGTGQETT